MTGAPTTVYKGDDEYRDARWKGPGEYKALREFELNREAVLNGVRYEGMEE